MSSIWHGVLPAITTPFSPSLEVDHERAGEHCRRLVDAGCGGVIPSGSLGEGATLTVDEKVALAATCVEAIAGDGAVVLSVAALSTAAAVDLAKRAAAAGCDGLMVLPPYAYSTDWREMKQHVATVIAATDLPCMLYNNPAAYGTDFLPEQIAELADEHPNLAAVKESSMDVRRVTELVRLTAGRLDVLVGIDDVVVEGVAAGAGGWVAGLANALPEDSVRLFRLARDGRHDEARELYEWFLPLLRLDTKPKLVQLIKFVQEQAGQGDWHVRPPRLPLEGDERGEVEATVRAALERRPALVVD